ncbi:MAG: thermonuclease family protein [Dehalococcoidia bacterium]|nr:thermonuclease family protein [Dehalococcoidia bacterium]MCB9485784.1 thermonuclease family protein [Thermoflexaceae bacterium]
MREGYAVRYRDAEDTAYRTRISEAEDEARKARRGLWSACP